MLTPREKEDLRKDLQIVNSAQDLFDFLSARYDLSSVKLGFLIKPKMIDGAIDIINALNPKKKR